MNMKYSKEIIELANSLKKKAVERSERETPEGADWWKEQADWFQGQIDIMEKEREDND